jgi:hypothetical protein
LLSDGGCSVDIYCVKDSWVLQNSFYDKWIPASDNTEVFMKELLDLINKSGDHYKWIIPGDDPVVRLLNDAITSEELFYKVLPLTKIENRAGAWI